MVASIQSTLPPITQSTTLQAFNRPQLSGPQTSSASGSSFAQLEADTYTSSASAAAFGNAPSALAGYDSYVSPTEKAWQTLQQSISSGDMAAAQTALRTTRKLWRARTST